MFKSNQQNIRPDCQNLTYSVNFILSVNFQLFTTIKIYTDQYLLRNIVRVTMSIANLFNCIALSLLFFVF